MTFLPRPPGYTLKRFQDALLNPVPESERFDPELPIAMRCSRCGKHAFGPRKHMKEAMEEHWRSACEARRTKADAPMEARIVYPRH